MVCTRYGRARKANTGLMPNPRRSILGQPSRRQQKTARALSPRTVKLKGVSRNTTILEPPWLSTPLKIQPDFTDLVLTNPVLTGDLVTHGSCRRSPAAPLR